MADVQVIFTNESGLAAQSFTAVPSKCTVSRTICSAELQHQASTAQLEFPYDPDLFKFLFTGGSGDPAAPGELSVGIKEGGEYVFLGRLASQFSWTDLGEPWPADKLSLSLTDDTEKLNIPAPRELGWKSKSIAFIVHYIAVIAGVKFPFEDSIEEPGQERVTLVIDEGKNLKSVLDAFLLQYGYSYYFNELNQMTLFAIPRPDSPQIEDTLGASDIIGSPQISQQDRNYTGIKVSYSTLTLKKNEQVYFQGGGYRDDNSTAPIILQKDVYFPFESSPIIEADEGQVWQTYETGYAETRRKYNGELEYRRSSRAQLLYTENHEVMPEWEGDIEIDRTEFGFRRASVRLVNRGETDANLYCLAIRADAWYAETESSVTIGNDGSLYTMECEYIYDYYDARRLANTLSKYFLRPCYKMTAQSEKRIAPGTMVEFYTGLSGFTKTGLVVSAQYDYDKELWTYTLIGYGGAAKLDITRAKSHSSNVPVFSEIAAVKKKVDALPGADTTPPSVPVITSLTGDDYGNAHLVFSPSIDTGSGMSRYNIYRRHDGGASTYQYAGTVPHDPNTPQFAWDDMTEYKNRKFYYKVTAVDKAGNESSASNGASFTSTVKINPRPPEALSAMALQSETLISWNPFQSADAALRADHHEVELSRDGGSTWTKIADAYAQHYDYWFDRSTDGYPEKDVLSQWRLRIRSVSVYGNVSDYVETEIDLSTYKTWKITGLVATCRASEKLISLVWSANPDFYGILRYDLYKGETKLLDGVSAQSYRDYLEGYPEKTDLDEVSYRLVARTEADSAETGNITVDTSGYLTYKITPPAVSVRADEFGLHIEWTGKTEPYYLQPVYDVLIDGVKAAEGMSALSLDVPFPEDNPYPHKETVAEMEVVIVARTDADEAHSETAHPDVTGFKGWVPSVPSLYITASGRTVPLSWNVQDIWGWRGCDVQVAKAYKVADGKYEAITDDSELEWYAPALGKNPYESLDNYRHGDGGGWLSVDGTSVAFTVPLWGQQKDESGNIMGAVNTLYAYRVRGASIADKSEWSEPFYAEARATSAFDVVKAWRLNDNGEKVRIDGALGVQQIFVEELAALSANLGLITDGGLFGGDYNYWAVNDTPMPDGSTLWKGSFRVGDETQYIKATPVLDESGSPTGRIDLEFRAGQFTINASGTRIDGKSFEVFDADGKLMFSVSPEGSKIRVEEGAYNSKDVQLDIDTQIYYTNALTVQWNNEVYILVPNYIGGSESDYAVSVFKVEDASRHELVWTIQGSHAYLIYIYATYLPYVRTENGRFHFVGPDLEDENAVCYYTYDIAAQSCGVAGISDNSVATIMNNIEFFNNNPMFFIDGVLFIYTKTEETLVDNSTLVYTNILLVTREHILKLLPDNGGYALNGVAVHGGFAYASAQSSIATLVVRCNLTTGELSYCIFYGDVRTNYSDFEVNGSGLMVDDYGMRLIGQCILFTSMDPYVTEHFWGAVCIPHAAARWNGWDGTSQFEGSAVTTGIETYIYFSEEEAERHGQLFPQFPFVSAGRLFVTELTEKDGSISSKLFRLRFADNDPPEVAGDITRRGALVADSAVLSFRADEENPYEIYKIYSSAGVCGACFPNTVVGIDAVQMAFCRIVLQNDQDVGVYPSLYTIFKEQKILITGSNVYSAGIGFNRIVYDTVSKKYRYYLDTGAYIEFDSDGVLASQRGERGADGRDGKDGVDGKDGKDGAFSVDDAPTADIADANYAVGVKADGTVTKTLWSKVWEWIKSKVETKSMASGIINACDTGESTPSDNDWTLTQYAGGSSSTPVNNTPIRRKFIAVWNYIKAKIESIAHSPLITSLKYNTGIHSGTCLSVEKLTSSGSKLILGAGGNTYVGGGESATTIAATESTETENLNLSSDENVRIITGVQEGVANAKTTEFKDDGSASFPGAIDITNASNSNSATPVKAIGGKMAANDYWRIAAGGTSNAGFLELATADDGTEPIYIRQYSGVFTTLVRTLTLLDGSGNTSFPGIVSGTFKLPTSTPSNLQDGMIWIS